MTDDAALAEPRPAAVCRALLAALDAAEGRRRRRKRDTRADEIGLGLKRALLERAIAEDPDPRAFEAWLLEQCLHAEGGEGGLRAMAREIRDEWRLARASADFGRWLEHGAPSDDRAPAGRADDRG
jgi:hypothetical protein